MIDGIKILNLSVSADGLLNHPLLMFPLPIDEKTGAILDDRPRRANYRGLTFKLTPSRTNRSKLVCELKGSLHSYKNGGRNNADDFTATDLLVVLQELITRFEINPHQSYLNNVEFGLNIALPFPVADVLNALICYKGEPFVKDVENGGIYYQATLSHYAVKMYDKGKQFALPGYLLRVEIKVLKMQYLTSKGIYLSSLADLLRVEQYSKLGKLLSDTVAGILFDDPTLTRNPPETLPASDRELLREGRYAGFWQRSPGLVGKEYEREKKRLQRQEQRFRELVSQYRINPDWQTITAEQLRLKWQYLTVISDELGAAIAETLDHWHCPDFTGFLNEPVNRETLPAPGLLCPDFTGPEKPEMSRFYTLSLGENRDTPTNGPSGCLRETFTASPPTINTTGLPYVANWKCLGSSVDYCLTTGLNITHQKKPHRFVSAQTVATQPTLLDYLLTKHRRNKRIHNHPEPYYAAHNVRNTQSNPPNNLRRRIERILSTPGLFDVKETLRLTPAQKQLLDYWKGSPYDLMLKRMGL